jgi:hypothetical protein
MKSEMYKLMTCVAWLTHWATLTCYAIGKPPIGEPMTVFDAIATISLFVSFMIAGAIAHRSFIGLKETNPS